MLFKILRFWPGATGVFRYGRWSFLITSLSFSLCLNTLIILNLYWSEFLTLAERFYTLIVFCCLAFAHFRLATHFENKISTSNESDKKLNLFFDAVTQYLQGNWFETECFLNEILKSNPRDVEAMLMLATMFRRTGRHVEAMQTLTNMQKIEDSLAWEIEIESELHLLTPESNRLAK